MNENNRLLFWKPPPPPRVPAMNYFWSFHLTNPAPGSAYAEVIFFAQTVFLPIQGPSGPVFSAPLFSGQLAIGDIVGISAGTLANGQRQIPPFDVTGADLDLALSAKLGATSVSVVSGVATLNNIGLYLNSSLPKGYLQLFGGPQNKANGANFLWTAGSIVNGTGIWSPKNTWSTFGHMASGPDNPADPPLTQPTSGEFSQ
jgi:hypothetical protein